MNMSKNSKRHDKEKPTEQVETPVPAPLEESPMAQEEAIAQCGEETKREKIIRVCAEAVAESVRIFRREVGPSAECDELATAVTVAMGKALGCQSRSPTTIDLP